MQRARKLASHFSTYKEELLEIENSGKISTDFVKNEETSLALYYLGRMELSDIENSAKTNCGL